MAGMYTTQMYELYPTGATGFGLDLGNTHEERLNTFVRSVWPEEMILEVISVHDFDFGELI